jgi:hypothetical protein
MSLVRESFSKQPPLPAPSKKKGKKKKKKEKKSILSGRRKETNASLAVAVVVAVPSSSAAVPKRHAGGRLVLTENAVGNVHTRGPSLPSVALWSSNQLRVSARGALGRARESHINTINPMGGDAGNRTSLAERAIEMQIFPLSDGQSVLPSNNYDEPVPNTQARRTRWSGPAAVSGSLVSLFLFFVICATCLSCYIFVSSFITSRKPGAQQHRFDVSLFRCPPCHSLFLIGIPLCVAEFVVIVSKGLPSATHRFCSRAGLLVFLSIVAFFAAAPELAYLHIDAPQAKTFDTLNCTDLRHVSITAQNQLRDAIPHLDFGADLVVFTNGVSVESVGSALARIKLQMNLLKVGIDYYGSKKFPIKHQNWRDYFLDPYCNISSSIGMATFFKCSFSDCSPSKSECALRRELNFFMQCAIDRCLEANGMLCDAPEGGLVNLFEFLTLYPFTSGGLKEYGGDGMIAQSLTDLVGAALRRILQLNVSRLNTYANNDECYDIKEAKRNGTHGNTRNTRIRCDPEMSTYLVKSTSVMYDSSLTFSTVLLSATVCVFLAGYGKPPELPCGKNSATMVKAQISTFFLGILTSLALYTRAVNLEDLANGSIYLQAWAVVYFVTSAMTLRHSFFLLLSSPDNYAHGSSPKKFSITRYCCLEDAPDADGDDSHRDSIARDSISQASIPRDSIDRDSNAHAHDSTDRDNSDRNCSDSIARSNREVLFAIEEGGGDNDGMNVEGAANGLERQHSKTCDEDLRTRFRTSRRILNKLKNQSMLPVALSPEKKRAAKSALRQSWKLRKEFTKVSGRYYFLHLALREVFETITQLAGLGGTAKSLDIDAVVLRATILSLNLILLPVLIGGLYWRLGNIFSRIGATIFEKLFDRMFIYVGVLMAVQANADGSSDAEHIWDVFARHGPVLLPVFFFLIKPRGSLQKLVAWSEARKLDAATRIIQRFVRARVLSQFRSRSDVRWSFVINRFSNLRNLMQAPFAAASKLDTKEEEEEEERGNGTGTTTSIAARRCVVAITCLRSNAIVLCLGALALLSLLVGTLLLTYVSVAIRLQSATCREQFGPIADCLRPRLYFRSEGIFGRTDCAFEKVVSANCSSGRLPTTMTRLPDTPDIWATMQLLERIDVSSNPSLVSAPQSLSLVPTLRVLNFSGTSLRGLPFKVCNMPTLTSLDLMGTPASTALDWSDGQLRNASWEDSLSSACTAALENNLVVLNLSRNSLRCQDYDIIGVASQLSMSSRIVYHAKKSNPSKSEYLCDFQNIVMPMKALMTVDLSHNSLDSVNIALQEVLRGVVDTNIVQMTHKSGVLLVGNPIAAISFVGTSSSYVEAWLQSLAQGNVPAKFVRLLTITGSMEGVWPWIKSSVLQSSIEKLSLRSVDLLATFEGLGRMQELTELYFDSLPSNGEMYGVNAHWFDDLPKLRQALLGTGARSLVSRAFMDNCSSGGLIEKVEGGLRSKPSYLLDLMEFNSHSSASANKEEEDCWCTCRSDTCSCQRRSFTVGG